MEPLAPEITTITDDAHLKMGSETEIIRWQRFARFIMRPVMSACGREIIFGFDENDLLTEKTYMVVSNHQSQLDAFVLLASFSPNVFIRLKPFRAMTANRFLQRGAIKYAALGMGCYPAKPHSSMPFGVEYATTLIKRGHTVYICPEGKIDRGNGQSARPGVAILAKVPSVEIIPVHIKWTSGGRWRKSFQLTYGKPFDGSEMTAQEILDSCYALPLG